MNRLDIPFFRLFFGIPTKWLKKAMINGLFIKHLQFVLSDGPSSYYLHKAARVQLRNGAYSFELRQYLLLD